VRLLHTAGAVTAAFDDPNLVSRAGLEPVMRLAEDADLHGLVAEKVHVPTDKGANAAGKVATIVAGMVAGADSIDKMNIVRDAGTRALFGGVYAPSTLGSFLRTFSHGHVQQLHSVARQFLLGLVRRTKGRLLAGVEQVCFVDIDSMLRRVYGKAKQGAGFGHAKVGGYNVLLRGYNPLLATLSTLVAAPVLAAVRLRGGKAGSARGAASMVAETIATAKAGGATALIIVRADSAFYAGKVIRACRRAGARFSVTVRMDAAIKRAIAAIPDDAWVHIRYPQAIWDEQEQRWISDAQIAEIVYTAFAGTKHEVTARLIVRRVKRLNPQQRAGQEPLFALWRHHAVFTDSPFTLLQAEAHHRGHAVIEQVNADLVDGPLAHLPSGDFNANAAWLICAAIAHNLLRAAGHLAAPRYGKARAATLRNDIINVAARVAHRARQIILHLPAEWPWQNAWTGLFTAVHAPPA
jgi:Transposase DDE domain group 1